jgi:hypothetical protein
MTTFDASRDYWSDRSPRLGRSPFQVDMDEAIASVGKRIRADRRHARNRFLLFVLMNMLFWPLVAFIGFQITHSHTPAVSKSLLVTTGAQAMNADKLVATVVSHGRPVFWLNRISGDTYTENSETPGVDVITYLPENATSRFQNQSDLMIRTFKDTQVYNVQLRPLSATADATVENVGGVSVTYNPASPDHSVVKFNSRPQIVAITYPGFQTLSTLVMDAQNLAPID